MNQHELRARAKGYTQIAGIDEVGRGPLAGPVVAAAVILPDGDPLPGIKDSKKLSSAKRVSFFQLIQEKAESIGIGVISEQTIDRINILQATKKAMEGAVAQLPVRPDYLLIDALKLERIPIPQEAIVKGDNKSVSIAAASVIAKVTRDRMMEELSEMYPEYAFAQNKGYGTRTHMEALYRFGPSPVHRKSFAPCSSFITKSEREPSSNSISLTKVP